MSGTPEMAAPHLSAYETYYQRAGLAEYERVFQHNAELDIEVAVYTERMATWPGLHAPSLRILDIGCGLGTFTIKLLQSLFNRADGAAQRPPPALTFDLIDINPTAFEEFKPALSKLQGIATNVDQTAAVAWQDVATDELPGKYDLIVANHTFYGAPINSHLIQSLLDRLAPNGLILLALCSHRSDIYQMRRRVGIEINTGEDIEHALLASHCNIIRVPYESKFYFDLNQPMFRSWLFATASADDATQVRLIDEYKRNDGRMDYMTNRALIHILWHPSDVDAAEGESPPSPADW